jgi:hypothetical protein
MGPDPSSCVQPNRIGVRLLATRRSRGVPRGIDVGQEPDRPTGSARMFVNQMPPSGPAVMSVSFGENLTVSETSHVTDTGSAPLKR